MAEEFEQYLKHQTTFNRSSCKGLDYSVSRDLNNLTPPLVKNQPTLQLSQTYTCTSDEISSSTLNNHKLQQSSKQSVYMRNPVVSTTNIAATLQSFGGNGTAVPDTNTTTIKLLSPLADTGSKSILEFV